MDYLGHSGKSDWSDLEDKSGQLEVDYRSSRVLGVGTQNMEDKLEVVVIQSQSMEDKLEVEHSSKVEVFFSMVYTDLLGKKVEEVLVVYNMVVFWIFYMVYYMYSMWVNHMDLHMDMEN